MLRPSRCFLKMQTSFSLSDSLPVPGVAQVKIREFACLLDRNGDCDGHTNRGCCQSLWRINQLLNAVFEHLNTRLCMRFCFALHFNGQKRKTEQKKNSQTEVQESLKFDEKTWFYGLLACLFDSNCNSYGHTDHGVVTCADEAHHFYALESWRQPFWCIATSKSLARYAFLPFWICKILFAEHIVFSFAECIISRFDAFANGVLINSTNCLRLIR